MRSRFLRNPMLTLGIAAAASLATGFAFVQSQSKNGDTPVEVNKLPAAVQATAKKIFGKLDGLKATTHSEHGIALFEVSGKGAEGMDVSLSCVTGGQVHEIERQIPMSQLPADATPNLQKAFPGATVLSAEEVESHYFEVKVKLQKDGKEKKIAVGASGSVYMEEEDEEGEEDEDGEEGGG